MQQDLNTLAPAKNANERSPGDVTGLMKRDPGVETGREGALVKGCPAAEICTRRSKHTDHCGAHPSARIVEIVTTASKFYDKYKLRRVYYTAFSPIPSRDARLPLQAPPLVREHRLYQADWLLRYYGFTAEELLPAKHPNLSEEHSPKLSWALRNRHLFPIYVNRAPKSMLLRVPGIGVRNAERMVQVRRHHKLRFEDLVKLRVNMTQAKFFITTADQHEHVRQLDRENLAKAFRPPPKQLALFGDPWVSRQECFSVR